MNFLIQSLEPLLTLFGGIAVVLTATAAAAFAILRLFGEKWLSGKFEKHLAAYKHDQQKELEHLKFKMNGLIDRAVKLHTKEFEVLPEAWSRLTGAFHSATSILHRRQSYPDLSRMSNEQLDEFLLKTDFAEWQKNEIRSSTDKTKLYIQYVMFQQLHRSEQAVRDAAIYKSKNGVFMLAEMNLQFEALQDLIWKALAEHGANESTGIIPKLHAERDALFARGEELRKTLEAAIHARLWNSQVDAI